MKSKFYSWPIMLALLFPFCARMNAQSPDSPPWTWVKSLSSTYSIYGNAIAIDPNGSGDIYVAGGFEGTVDFDPGPETFKLSTGSSNVGIFVSKFDGLGNFIWAKSMVGLAGAAFAGSIAIDPASGAIYTTGRFEGTVDFDPGKGIRNITSAITSASAICSGYPFCGDIFISKLDGEGNFIWARGMGGPGDDFGSSLAIDPGGSGDVYITGQFKDTVDFDPGTETSNLASAGNYDIFISRFNSSGNFLWAKEIGGDGIDLGRSIALDPTEDGDIYITGCFEGTVDFDPGQDIFNLSMGSHNVGIFISKLDNSGNFIWAKPMGKEGVVGIGGSGSLALDPAGSGDVYITSSFQGSSDFNPGEETFPLTSAGISDIFISKLSGSGHFKWAKAMGGISQELGTSVAIEPGGSGNVYTIGKFNGTVDFDPGAASYELTSAGAYDIFISKLDSSGHFLWVKEIKGTSNEFSHSIVLDDCCLYLTGFFTSPSVSFDSITLTNVNPPRPGADLFIAKLSIMGATAIVDSKAQPLKIYPNPVTDELTIELEGDKFFKEDITLFNVLGEAVFSSTEQYALHKKTIDISPLATGIYFLEVNMDGNRVVEKIVKE